MKQEISTKNYNTTIQIPYRKLATTNPNFTKLPSQPSQSPCQCQCQQSNRTKIITIKCCQQNSNKDELKANMISLEILEELEKAFQTDMQQKDARILGLENSIEKLDDQLKFYRLQLQKKQGIIHNLQNKQNKLQQELKDKDRHIAQLNSQILQLTNQKQKLLNSKFQQLQTNFYKTQEQQQNKYTNFKQQIQNTYKIQLNQLQNKGNTERSSYMRQIQQLKNMNQYIKNGNIGEVNRLMGEIGELKKKVGVIEEKLGQEREKEVGYIRGLGQKDIVIGKKQVQIQVLTRDLLKYKNIINQNNYSIQKLSNQLTTSKNSYNNLNQNYNILTKQYTDLTNRLQKLQHQNSSLHQANENLTKKITQLQQQLALICQQYRNKQTPKLYQVKIQKVIDRQEYIDSLLIEIQQFRRDNLYLLERVQHFQAIIQSRDRQITERNLRIVDLEDIVLKLQMYIQEKQRSVSWIVQKQINRDMHLSKPQIGRTGNVYQTVPKIYYNFKQVRQMPNFQSNTTNTNITKIYKQTRQEQNANNNPTDQRTFNSQQQQQKLLRNAAEIKGQQIRNAVMKKISQESYRQKSTQKQRQRQRQK